MRIPLLKTPFKTYIPHGNLFWVSGGIKTDFTDRTSCEINTLKKEKTNYIYSSFFLINIIIKKKEFLYPTFPIQGPRSGGRSQTGTNLIIKVLYNSEAF